MDKRFFKIAINISKQMSFANKFMAIIAMLSVPLLFLLAVLLIDTNTSIQKTKKELQGVHSLQSIVSTLYKIQDFRDYAVLQEVNLDNQLISFITEEKKRITESIEQLAFNLSSQKLININIQEQIDNVKKEWQQINESQAVMRGGIESQFLHFDKVVLELQLLSKIVTFESALIHDDNPINFYLINNFVNEAPKIYKSIGFLRAAGAYALSMPSVDSYTYHILEKLAAQVEDNIALNDYASSHIAIYLNEDDNIQNAMKEIVDTSEALLAFTYEQILDEPESLPNWHTYFDFFSQEITQMRAFDAQVLEYVDLRLKEREFQQNLKFYMLLLVTLLLYLIIVYFVYGIYLQLRHTLNNYSLKAMQLASGDLETRIQDFSKDEFGDLAKTFNEMAEIISKNQSKLIEAEKMGSLSRMISGIAHEINTPLGVVITCFSMSKHTLDQLNTSFENRTLDENELREFVISNKEAEVLIEKNLDKAVNLIETFKQVNSSLNVSPQKGVELRSLIEFAYLPIAELNDDVEFIITGDECEIDTDVNLLTQALSNIIENAIEHGLNNQTEKEVNISISSTEEQVLLSISDNGIGICKDEIRQVFEPFYTTGRIKGKVGLGMHIVYLIITQSLEGSIKIVSEENRYTRLDVILPKYRDDCEEVDIDLDDYL